MGEGGIREIFTEEQGGNFLRRNINFYGRTERKKGEKFGIYWREICTLSEGGCCPFYWYVGSGARKPVGFLGPANLGGKSKPAIRLLQEQERERQEQEREQEQSRVQEKD